MAQVYTQSSNTPDHGSISACSPTTAFADGGHVVTEIGTTLVGSGTEQTLKQSASTGENRTIGMVMESVQGEPADASWESGNWTVRMNVTAGNTDISWQGCYVCRLSSGGVSQETIASATNIMMPLTAGVHASTIAGVSSTAASTGDRIYIVNTLDFFGSHGQIQAGITPDQNIDSPLTTGTSGVTVTESVADIAVAADSATVAGSLAESLLGSVRSLDTETETLSAGAVSESVLDTGRALDLVDDVAALTVAETDTASAGDTVGVRLSFGLNNETPSALDAVEDDLTSVEDLLEAAVAADRTASSVSTPLAETLTDSARATDATDATISAVEAMAESVAASEVDGSDLSALQSDLEAARATDSVLATLSGEVVERLTEAARAGETVTATLLANVTPTDTARAGDRTDGDLTGREPHTETGQASDVASVELTAAPSVTDAVDVTDLVSSAVSGAASESVTDGVVAEDTTESELSATDTERDTATARDLVSVTITQPVLSEALLESVAGEDSVLSSLAALEVLTDRTRAVDSALALLGATEVVVDAARSGDAVSVTLTGVDAAILVAALEVAAKLGVDMVVEPQVVAESVSEAKTDAPVTVGG